MDLEQGKVNIPTHVRTCLLTHCHCVAAFKDGDVSTQIWALHDDERRSKGWHFFANHVDILLSYNPSPPSLVFQHFHGLEEAIYRNIQACKELSVVTKSSYGPNGMNKMVINHLEKLFVTNDAATVLKELEVQHPAAKMIVMATQTMEQEVIRNANTHIRTLTLREFPDWIAISMYMYHHCIIISACNN